MGCASSLDEKSKNCIHENMLASVIAGKIADDDYLARSHKVLNDLVITEPVNTYTGADNFMDINRSYMMLEPGSQALEHGYVRQSDGCWYIAVATDLGTECNGEMFDWWFRNCTDTERFKWWHPKNHKSGNWDPQFFAVQPEDRPFGYYVNHSHKVTQLMGGNMQTLQIEFDRPSKYFDISKFENAGVTACIVARIHIINSHGLSGVAHMIHIVREADGVSELRSRIWLGDFNRVDDNSVMPLWCINCLGNSKFFRYTKAPASFARAVWVNCLEEMQCLKAFLPDYYREEMACRAVLEPFETRMNVEEEDDEILLAFSTI